MAPIRRRTDPNIDAYVEYRSPHASHQLTLRMRWRLKMQAAEDALLPRMDVIVLHEDSFDAMGREGVRAKGLRKKTPLVAVSGRFHQQDVRNFQPLDLHCHSR
jgi:hypothetical protein